MNSWYYLGNEHDVGGVEFLNHYTIAVPDSLRSILEASVTRYTLAIFISITVIYISLSFLGFPVLNMAASILNIDDTKISNMQANGGIMLSGVLGLGDGLRKGVQSVTGALSKSYGSKVPAGLGNGDNSCYQNSVIQGLASLHSLRDYLASNLREEEEGHVGTTKGALFDMISKLQNPENFGQRFWIRGVLKSMSTWQQQDAQEYYSKILDALDKEAQKASKKKEPQISSEDETSPVAEPLKDSEDSEPAPLPEQPNFTPNPLDGLLAQRVGCINCGYTEGLSMIPFNCMTVPLGSGQIHDVRECLDEYTKLEYIEGVECAKCTLIKMKDTLARLAVNPESPFAAKLQAVEEALGEDKLDDKTMKTFGIAKKNYVQTTKSRQAVISRAPKALVLHVNRSIFDEMTGAQLKNYAPVLYPQILDLGNWCLGSRPSENQKLDEEVEERWPKDPNVSMIDTSEAALSSNSPFQYRLRATVTHFGSHGYGHYVCFRQQPFPIESPSNSSDTNDTDQPQNDLPQNATTPWWRFSDDSVREVAEETAVRQDGVFMLFYERIDDEAELLPTALGLPSEEVSMLPVGSAVEHSNSFDFVDAINVPLPDQSDSLSTSPAVSPKISPLEPKLGLTISPNSVLPDTEPSSPKITEANDEDTVMSEADAALEDTDMPQVDASHEDTEVSEADTTNYESEETASTLMTSDDEGGASPEALDFKEEINTLNPTALGLRLMRTAGNTPNQDDRPRESLPMVPAV